MTGGGVVGVEEGALGVVAAAAVVEVAVAVAAVVAAVVTLGGRRALVEVEVVVVV